MSLLASLAKNSVWTEESETIAVGSALSAEVIAIFITSDENCSLSQW